METKWVIFDDVEDGFRGIYETEADAITARTAVIKIILFILVVF